VSDARHTRIALARPAWLTIALRIRPHAAKFQHVEHAVAPADAPAGKTPARRLPTILIASAVASITGVAIRPIAALAVKSKAASRPRV
jgi:hypothetical protein